VSASTKVLLALAEVVAAVMIIRYRSARQANADFGLRRPAIGALVGWVALYAAWMLGTNAIWHWRGPWDFTEWRNAPLLVDAGRVLAVGILGPIGEELIFRGILMARIANIPIGKTDSGPVRIGIWPAMVISAIAWTVLHVQYDASVLLLIVVDGLLLGTARVTTKSVWVPVAMHIVWNLYAVW
jgi:membrane protease YdiL (CAAX protease family)